MTPKTYERALTEAKAAGLANCSDEAVMASFCASALQILVGAVSPKLVWEGAQVKGLTANQLAHLAGTDVKAVDDLQWVSA